MKCPYCGSCDIRDLGYDDGGGDYGDSVTAMVKCELCNTVFEEREIVNGDCDDGYPNDQDGDQDAPEIQEYDGRPIVNRYDPPFKDY